MATLIAFDERSFRIALAQSGFRTVTGFVKSVGVSKSYGRQITKGLVPSPNIRRRIADRLGVTPETIWKPVTRPEPTLRIAG